MDDSAAVRRLPQMFDNGQLTGEEAVGDVKKMNPLFEPFLLATFKNKSSEIREQKATKDGKLIFLVPYGSVFYFSL